MSAPRTADRTVSLPAGTEAVAGDLVVPEGAIGLVVFAHGSGSSRTSGRNRAVAATLQRASLATLLFDLLTPSEERLDDVTAELRFDIPFLARRVGEVLRYVAHDERLGGLPLGLFGASTGAAAALVGAAGSGGVGAIVSRGGRPDLAADALGSVRSPTLLIVGGLDTQVGELNRRAFERLAAPDKDLVVVPGASHLFEEAGALDEVARLAGAWFERWLGG